MTPAARSAPKTRSTSLGNADDGSVRIADLVRHDGGAGGVDDDHGAAGVVGDAVGHVAEQELLAPAHPEIADHYGVGALVLDGAQDALRGVLIDDDAGRTVVSVAWIEGDLRKLKPGEQAKKAGEELAARAKKEGIEACVFDRGGYRYHGRVRALAEGAREGGLKF